MTQGASRRSTVAMPRPPGPWLVVLCRPLWRAPCPLPPPGLPGCPHSRNAGAALLTRVELGWGGQGPGGGQGGLGAQRAGQEGRRATWEGEGHTDTSELVPAAAASRLFIYAHSACSNMPRTLTGTDAQTGVAGRGGGALWSNTGHESEDRRKRVITPDLWLGPGQGRKAELARAKAPTVHTECPTWQAKQTFRLARPSHDDINGG